MTGSLEGSRILVTGAGGFIGSALVQRLVGLGADVRAFLRYTSRAEMGLLKFQPEDLTVLLPLTRFRSSHLRSLRPLPFLHKSTACPN